MLPTSMGETKISAVDDDTNTSQEHRHSNLLLTLPSHLWRHILTFSGYKDYTLTGRTCQYLKRLWTQAVKTHRIIDTLFVPVDCNTLQEAVDRVHGDNRLTTIVVGKGEHQIDGNYLMIHSAMNIVGDPGVAKEEIVVVGGFFFNAGIQGICHLQHLTLRQAEEYGVYGQSSFTMEEVLVEQCGYGVLAHGTGVVARCTDVEVRQCEWSGVTASSGASITLIGAKTTVHHNCTNGDSDEYGLRVFGSPCSTIHLVSPLTKEHVSLDNGGGGNWGAVRGGADLNQIKTIAAVVILANESTSNSNTARDVLQTLPKFMKHQILAFFGYKDYTLTGRTCQYLKRLWTAAVEKKRLPLFVPVDCNTLKEAVGRVLGDDRLTTIVVGKGEHQIDGIDLKISSAMNIVGDPGVPKSEIVVVGGINFTKGIPGNCHLQHLTLSQAKNEGVYGQSSFTMDEVLVEQCGYGVLAHGTGVVARCTNVEVRQCGWSGVVASGGASITLIGAKTTVHHNCTTGVSRFYGLQVYGSSSSTIQLVSPLAKEQVSLDNGGGGNWGAECGGDIHQIKTIGYPISSQ
jgi:hypothetical protein